LTGSAAVLVVIDANVFVSTAIQRGASHRVIEVWLSGRAHFEVVMCPQLLGEIREVLTNRPRLRKWISPETATPAQFEQHLHAP
jgi:predicted nucleic acid-binding protein